MDRLLLVILLLSVTPASRSQTFCTLGSHCSHICIPYQHNRQASKQPPCIRLDVTNIRPVDPTHTYGKCLIVTISRDKRRCSLFSFLKKSPKSLALQAVAEDGYPIGGFPRIPATGASISDYAAMETLCSHDTDEVKQFDTRDTTRIRSLCPKKGLKSKLKPPGKKYPQYVELKPKFSFGTGYEGIQVVWCPIELSSTGDYPGVTSDPTTKLRFILEYTIQDGGITEIARVTSGVFEFKFKFPFAPHESNYGKKSCSPFPTSPFVEKDNPSISGYPDRNVECCQVDKGYLPMYTLPLPPPPKPVICSKTTGRHCSHICKPFQQDQPYIGWSPCLQLDVMGITPPTPAEAKTFAKCLIVTISRDPSPACDPAKKLKYTSLALQAVIGSDGFIYGGFPALPPAPSGKPQTDKNAMETLCRHTGKAKLYDTRDTIRSSETCPRDNQFFDDPGAQEDDYYPQFITLSPKSQFIDGVYEGIQVVWCPTHSKFMLNPAAAPEELKFMLEYTIADSIGILDIGRVLSGSVTYKYDDVTPSNSNSGKKNCFQDPKAPFNPKDNPSMTGHPDEYSSCCHINPNYLPEGTPALPGPPSTPTPPPAPPEPPTPPPARPKSPTPPPPTKPPIIIDPPKPKPTTKKPGPPPTPTSKPIPESSIITQFLKDCEGDKKTKKCVPGIYDKDVPPNNEFQIKKEPCTSGKSCEIVLAYGGKEQKEDKKEDDEVILELMGASAYWISVGFSQDDRKMGNDFVTECVSESNPNNTFSPMVSLYNSWNYRNELEEKPYKKYQNKRITDPKFLSSKTVRLIKGVREQHERKIYLYCRFAIKKRFDYSFQAPGESKKVVYDFSLHRNPVFLIFALGQHKNSDDKFDTIEGNVNNHGSRRYFTNNRTTLGIKFYPSDPQKELLKAHGYIMYIIWIFFLPIANFVARYYKETLRKYSFCGTKFWLLVHVSFSGTALILVFAGYLILSKAKEDWQQVGGVQGNWHLYAGLTCSSLTFTNMYAGIFMPERETKDKWHVTEFVHGLIGHGAFLAGFAALHNAESVLFSSVPCSSKYILWVWLVVYFGFEVVMSYHHCWIDWINEKEARAWFCTVRAFFPAYDPNGQEDAPGVKIRLWILLAFVLFSAIILVSVCTNLAVTEDEKSCLSLEEVHSITKAAT